MEYSNGNCKSNSKPVSDIFYIVKNCVITNNLPINIGRVNIIMGDLNRTCYRGHLQLPLIDK